MLLVVVVIRSRIETIKSWQAFSVDETITLWDVFIKCLKSSPDISKTYACTSPDEVLVEVGRGKTGEFTRVPIQEEVGKVVSFGKYLEFVIQTSEEWPAPTWSVNLGIVRISSTRKYKQTTKAFPVSWLIMLLYNLLLVSIKLIIFCQEPSSLFHADFILPLAIFLLLLGTVTYKLYRS